MRVNRRFVVPTVSFLAGVTVPLALGATQVHVPQFDHEIDLGRMGKHRAMPNSVVVEVRGECFVLTWTPFQAPQKLGMITFNGTVHAVPLRDAEAPQLVDDGNNHRPTNRATRVAEAPVAVKERR
jgi:hypothetical protein